MSNSMNSFDCLNFFLLICISSSVKLFEMLRKFQKLFRTQFSQFQHFFLFLQYWKKSPNTCWLNASINRNQIARITPISSKSAANCLNCRDVIDFLAKMSHLSEDFWTADFVEFWRVEFSCLDRNFTKINRNLPKDYTNFTKITN